MEIYIYLTLPYLTWAWPDLPLTDTHTHIHDSLSISAYPAPTNNQPTNPPTPKRRRGPIVFPPFARLSNQVFEKNEPCDFPPPITDPELKYVAQKDMHTALLYIAKKQLNMEERAGEVVPSPRGVGVRMCGREGGQKNW